MPDKDEVDPILGADPIPDTLGLPEGMSEEEQEEMLRWAGEARAEYKQLVSLVKGVIEGMGEQGVIVGPEFTIRCRIEALIEFAFPNGSPQRLGLEVEVARHTLEELRKIQAELAETRRPSGKRVTIPQKKLIVPGM